MAFLHKYKKYVVICLSLISFIMIAATSRENHEYGFFTNSFGFLVTSTQAFFTNIGDWLGDRISFLTNMNNLHEENLRLRQEIQMLQIDNSRLLYVDAENQVLVDLLSIPRRYSDYQLMGANIIAQDPTNWHNTVIINRGAADGISRNMVVLAAGGLAGRISSVGHNFAVVTTLIEDNSNVSAASRRTSDIGMVRGDVSLTSYGLLRMERIAATADIMPGDEIITSHISSIYPPGIQIGYVRELGTEPNGLRYAIIEPSVDFSRLDAILIITELFYFEMIDLDNESE